MNVSNGFVGFPIASLTFAEHFALMVQRCELVYLRYASNTPAYVYLTSNDPAHDKPRARLIVPKVNEHTDEHVVDAWLTEGQLERLIDQCLLKGEGI